MRKKRLLKMPENSLVPGQDQSIPFCAMDIPESLKLGIQELGYVSPTNFQKACSNTLEKVKMSPV